MKKEMRNAVALGVTIMAIACAAVVPSIREEYENNKKRKVQQAAEERQKELWYTSYPFSSELVWCPGNGFILREEMNEENPVLYIDCHGWAVPTPQIHE